MAEEKDARSPSPATAGERKGDNIDLKLLSPSPEVPASGLLFEDISPSTTLGELRIKIQAALPSHPLPARQRIIYFGRVLQRDNDTLSGVFGETNVCIRFYTCTLETVLTSRGDQKSTNANAPPRPSTSRSWHLHTQRTFPHTWSPRIHLPRLPLLLHTSTLVSAAE